MKNRLYRDEHRKVLGGVCAGLADYFNVDISLVRVVFVLALILKGGGILFYIILWAVVPARPYVAPSAGFPAPPEPAPFAPVNKSVSISTGSIIGGLILIMLGGYLLLNQYNIIPDLDFDKLWPVILIIIGLVLMFGFWQRKPVEQQSTTWDKKDTLNDTSSTEHSQNI
jgi:phage shock protein C